MALVKCPRCDLNYILDGGTLCTVCRKEVKGEHDAVDTPEMCSECGEHPAMPGQEICIYCFKEMQRRSEASSTDDNGGMEPEETSLSIDPVSTMDEIDIELPDSSESPFGDEKFDDEDDEDKEDEEEE